MKQLIILTAVTLFFAVSTQAAEKAPSVNTGPEVIDLKSATMQIKFPHKKHQIALDKQCAKCHRSADITSPVWSAETAHKTCFSCHQEKTMGPSECSKCHKLK